MPDDGTLKEAAPENAETSPEKSDSNKLEELVAASPQPRLPRWVKLDEVPPLAWADGCAISRAALRFVIGRVLQLRSGPLDDELAGVVRSLNATAARVLYREIMRQVNERSSILAAMKWLLFARELFGDEENINQLGSVVDYMAGEGERKDVADRLRVLAMWQAFGLGCL